MMINFSLVRRVAVVLGLLALFAYGLLAAQLFIIGENPVDYHVDPLTISQTNNLNTYLAAPAAYASTTPHRESPVFNINAEDLMIAMDEIASNAPRTKLVAGARSDLWATYVQRSRMMRFPDYISIVAISLPDGGSTLAMYSQSVYGVSDFGVNKDRVDRWLQQLSESLREVRVD